MNTKRMTVRAFTKAVDMTTRTVEQIVSVFSNVDYGGDRVVLGAFTRSLGEWEQSGDPIPAIWSHAWDDPFAHIGAVLEAKELAPGDPLLPTEIAALGGLYVKYQVDDKPFADQVLHLLEKRRVREASFAYDVRKERRAADGANELVDLDLIEVGPTLKGMNPLTQLLSAKGATDHVRFVQGVIANLRALGDETLASGLEGHLAGLKAPHPPVAGAPAATSSSALKALTEVSFPGSYEERIEAVFEAAMAWAQGGDVGNGGFYMLHPVATYDDRAIVMVEGWNDPIGRGTPYLVPYQVAGDAVTLGEPAEVTVEGAVHLKGQAQGATVAPSPTAKGKGVPPEDPRSAAGPNSGEASRALLDIDLLGID